MSTRTMERNRIAPIGARVRDSAPTPLGNRPGINIVELPEVPVEVGVRISASWSEWGKDFYSPPHRHTFDQVQYMLKGRGKIGVQEVGPGDILFVPEGAFYGPLTLVGDETFEKVNIQVPGPTKGFYPVFAEQHAASAELKKIGTIEKGRFTRDGKTIDSFEAIVLHMTGEIPEYPDPLVRSATIFNTVAREWRPVEDRPGISVKHVAYLSEVGPNIKLVRIDPGAELAGSSTNWDEVRFVVEGSVDFEGESYPAPSGLFFPENCRFGGTRSAEGAVMMCVQIARHWSKAPPFLAL